MLEMTFTQIGHMAEALEVRASTLIASYLFAVGEPLCTGRQLQAGQTES